ncbi:MGDG synthase family glycosyltransferase [Gorillibacterium sp. sgz5001074]|uniref:MGDG synthase family glycosyltransferase n=1 Tax=Gorillibacterium sp. sgz5001074 TaxID=3446695 RepID=UPI003F6662D7
MSSERNGRTAILILTGNLGDGHRQAAAALAEEAHRLLPGAKIRVVDIVERTRPRTHRLSEYCYMQWITKLPWLYGWLFRMTKDDTAMARIFKSFRLVPHRPLMALLEEFRPDAVVCTFPSAAAAMAQLKRKGRTAVPIITVITDHTYHSYWVHDGTDRYIVGSERVRQALRQWSVPERAVAVTGIPVRKEFHREMNRRELRLKHGLDPSLPTVVIMGGGYGLIGGDWAKLLQAPELRARPMQAVIVCGRNDRLKERLLRDMQDYPHPLVVTGYIEHVHELMASADLLITKPGGLTTSEALAMGLPMLLYKPLPGQEYDNAAYLTGMGAAVQAGQADEFVHTLRRLLDHPEQLAWMKERVRFLARGRSAEMAVREIAEAARTEPEQAAYVRTRWKPGPA